MFRFWDTSDFNPLKQLDYRRLLARRDVVTKSDCANSADRGLVRLPAVSYEQTVRIFTALSVRKIRTLDA
jgi:hypothetical protein